MRTLSELRAFFAADTFAMEQCGITIDAVLRDNDAYHALEKTNGLIITGATGTNVNDVAVALIGCKQYNTKESIS